MTIMARKRTAKAADPTACVIYARYSSLAQRDQSIEDQVAACRRWAEVHGLTVAEVYADRHISGTTDSRPAFQRMVADAGRGEWATVVVYKTDRFARDRTDAAVYKRRLRECGVAVESAMETIPEGPEGIILESLLDGFAEYYSRNLAQNVMRGMTSNAERCKVNGVVCYGYRPGPDGRYEVDPVEAAHVREAFARRAAGEGPGEIARWLASVGARNRHGREPSYMFVRTMLSNRRYIGEYSWGGVTVPGGVPAIVDEDLFNRVQRLHRGRGASGSYPLSGVLHDAGSGAAYHGECATGRNGVRVRYYGVRGDDGKVRRVRADDVEAAVQEAVASVLADPALVDEVAMAAAQVAVEEAESAEVGELRGRLADLDREAQSIVDAIVGGVPASMVAARAQEVETLRESISERISTLTADVPTARDIAGFLKESFSSYMEDFDLCSCVDRVDLCRYEGDVEPVVAVTFAWGDIRSEPVGETQRTPCSDVPGEGVRTVGGWWAQ